MFMKFCLHDSSIGQDFKNIPHVGFGRKYRTTEWSTQPHEHLSKDTQHCQNNH